jgi:hypothetical protein
LPYDSCAREPRVELQKQIPCVWDPILLHSWIRHRASRWTASCFGEPADEKWGEPQFRIYSMVGGLRRGHDGVQWTRRETGSLIFECVSVFVHVCVRFRERRISFFR